MTDTENIVYRHSFSWYLLWQSTHA